jgi:predicted ATPase
VIRNLRIQGFKTAVDVSLELGQLNILIGANGAGKSNVLEALGLLACAAAGRVDYRTLQARGVRLGTPVLYKSALRSQKRLIEHIALEVSSERARYRVRLGNPTQGATVAWSYAAEEFVEDDCVLGERTDRARVLSLDREVEPGERDGLRPVVTSVHGRGPVAHLLELLDGFTIYAPCTPMLRERVSDPDPAEPLGLHGGGLAGCAFDLRDRPQLWERVQEEAFSLVDWATAARFGVSSDWTARRGAPPPSYQVLSLQDRHMIEELSWVSAREANEGALYALFVFLLLLNPDAPRLLAIENVDHSLNPRLVGALIERLQHILLNEPDCPQVLLTTQNPAVLDVLDLKDDRVRLFTVTRDRWGATNVKRFLYDEALEQVADKLMPLSYLWTSGAIGGMPLL